MKAHSRSRIRRLRGEPRDLVDMVIMDVPEGLLVPGIHADSTVPIWNSHPTRENERGRNPPSSIVVLSWWESFSVMVHL